MNDVMTFTLNLVEVLQNMRNEYGESLEDAGVSWREIVELLVEGELKFYIISTAYGDYLALDVPVKGGKP